MKDAVTVMAFEYVNYINLFFFNNQNPLKDDTFIERFDSLEFFAKFKLDKSAESIEEDAKKVFEKSEIKWTTDRHTKQKFIESV